MLKSGWDLEFNVRLINDDFFLILNTPKENSYINIIAISSTTLLGTFQQH